MYKQIYLTESLRSGHERVCIFLLRVFEAHQVLSLETKKKGYRAYESRVLVLLCNSCKAMRSNLD